MVVPAEVRSTGMEEEVLVLVKDVTDKRGEKVPVTAVISVASQITFCLRQSYIHQCSLKMLLVKPGLRRKYRFITNTKFRKIDRTIVNKHQRDHPPSRQDR
jgi:hypothetical protein